MDYSDEHQTDGQFLGNEGIARLPLPPPQEKSHAVDGVTEQGGGVVKGVPAEGEIKFFGFPDYESGNSETEPAEEDNEYEYYEEGEDEEEEEDEGLELVG